MTEVMQRQSTTLITMREAIEQSMDTLYADRQKGMRKADCKYVTSMILDIIMLTGTTSRESLPKNLKILLDGVAQRERTKDPIGFEVGSLIDTLSRAV